MGTTSKAYGYFESVMQENIRHRSASTLLKDATIDPESKQWDPDIIISMMWSKVPPQVKQVYKSHELTVRQFQQLHNKRQKIETSPRPRAAEGEAQQALVAASAVASAIVNAANTLVALSPNISSTTAVSAAEQVAFTTIANALRKQEQCWEQQYVETQFEIRQLEQAQLQIRQKGRKRVAIVV
jgi:hypothetical protein